jgi:DNA mismatch repair protein MutL
MSRSIRILPEHLANRIAAGEVVQRPAAAVKELLENSIDAGAKAITVVVSRGGKSLIQVIDDGSGMGPEDAALAFSRHATSKITTIEDLERITTLGFRGEALASISAVAQVEMITRRAEDELGTRIRVGGSGAPVSAPDSAPAGTSITVRNLFYNTPARQKFLKSDATEFRQICDAVQRIALAHPSIALKFLNGEETILDLEPSGLPDRVSAVFGPSIAKTVFPFEGDAPDMSVRGFLGKPDFARRSRSEQYMFLNNRSVASRSLGHAVFKAYEHLLEKGTFPLFILYLSIDPQKVDVNVHPSKLEVKFGDEGAVYRFVYSAVRRVLSEHDLIPSAGVTASGEGLAFMQPEGRPAPASAPWRELLRTRIPGEDRSTGDPGGPGLAVREGQADFESAREKGFHPSGAPQSPASPPQGPLWQIHDKYILAPVENGIMVIDQHAAHERVLYEKAVARFQGEGGGVQQLLFPHTFELSPADAALVGELLPFLTGLGFSVKLFGKTTIVLDGVPVDVKPGAEKTILPEILDLFKEDAHSVKLEPREKLAKSYSCKAAVKAGDPLNAAEMHSLLDQLFATKLPFVCPHGRPVMIRLSLAELDKRFGRTS